MMPPPGPYPFAMTAGDRVVRVEKGSAIPAARGVAGHARALDVAHDRAVRRGVRQRVTMARPGAVRSLAGRWFVQDVR